MEKDLVVGYMLIKVTSLLMMYLHQRTEPVAAYWFIISIGGVAAGAYFLLQSWRKARALVR